MSIQAIVYRNRKSRTGKGFSIEELKEVNLGFRKAFEMGIPIDTRRSTKHEANVGTLQKHLRQGVKPEDLTPVSETEEIGEGIEQKEDAVPKAATDLSKVKGARAIRKKHEEKSLNKYYINRFIKLMYVYSTFWE